MRPRRAAISGWARFPVVEADVYRAERMRELPDLLLGGRALLARGLGRSYGDAALAGTVVLMDRLDRFLSFDEDTAIVRCESGVSLGALLDVSIPRGFIVPVLPGTRHVTIGGAIACDIHGKNHHRAGSFATCIVAFDLLTADGAIQTCSRAMNTDLFWATLGGMGLTGIITDVTIQLERITSPHVIVRYDVCSQLETIFEHLARNDDRYVYSVAWVDALATGRTFGRGILMRANHSAMPDRSVTSIRPLAAPSWSPAWLINRTTVRAFNALYYRKQRDVVAEQSFDSYFFQLDRIANWNRLYGSGFLQYQFVVPDNGGVEGVSRALRMISESGVTATLGVLKRMGPAVPNQMLSFPIGGYTLAVDFTIHDKRVFSLLNELDAVVADHGGRIYLAKDARATAATVDRMYGAALERWREVKARVDPANRFTSQLAARLGLVA